MRLSLIRLAAGAPYAGNAGRMHGEYRFAVSPDVQKPFKGFWKDAFVNVFNQYVVRSWYFYVPTGLVYYYLYDWMNKEHTRLNRKDPYEYINDE